MVNLCITRTFSYLEMHASYFNLLSYCSTSSTKHLRSLRDHSVKGILWVLCIKWATWEAILRKTEQATWFSRLYKNFQEVFIVNLSRKRRDCQLVYTFLETVTSVLVPQVKFMRWWDNHIVFLNWEYRVCITYVSQTDTIWERMNLPISNYIKYYSNKECLFLVLSFLHPHILTTFILNNLLTNCFIKALKVWSLVTKNPQAHSTENGLNEINRKGLQKPRLHCKFFLPLRFRKDL